MRPIAYVSLPIAEFREKVNDFGNDTEGLSKWVQLFSKTLAMMGSNEPKDDFALRLLNDVESWRKAKADKMRKLREERKGEEKPDPVPQIVKTAVVARVEKKSPKVEKNVFGELQNVKFTVQEEIKLREKMGAKFDRGVDILSNYKASSGKNYKSDYAAMLNWVIGRVEEEESRGRGPLSQAQRLVGQIVGGRNG